VHQINSGGKKQKRNVNQSIDSKNQTKQRIKYLLLIPVQHTLISNDKLEKTKEKIVSSKKLKDR